MLPFALLLAAAAVDQGEERLAAMTKLYEEVCLKAFPDDGAVAAEMLRRGAKPLDAEQVKVTLGKDPGVGWTLPLGSEAALVFVELPPYHACSVRWPMPGEYKLTDYHAVEDAYRKANPGFKPIKPMEADMAGLHIHGVGVARKLPDGMETLLVVDQRVTDPTRRANGETGVMLRFVRQVTDKH